MSKIETILSIILTFRSARQIKNIHFKEYSTLHTESSFNNSWLRVCLFVCFFVVVVVVFFFFFFFFSFFFFFFFFVGGGGGGGLRWPPTVLHW